MKRVELNCNSQSYTFHKSKKIKKAKSKYNFKIKSLPFKETITCRAVVTGPKGVSKAALARVTTSHPICKKNVYYNFDDIGSGTSNDNYMICHPNQMIDWALNCGGTQAKACNGFFSLATDINMLDATVESDDIERITDGGIDYLQLQGAHYTIGDIENGFEGSFFGNNYNITNYALRYFLGDYNIGLAGIFGWKVGGEISNLNLLDIKIDSLSNIFSPSIDTGALVGHSQFTTFGNISVKNAKLKGVGTVGGLVGYAQQGAIYGSKFVNITIFRGNNFGNENHSAGGLLGSGRQVTILDTALREIFNSGNLSSQKMNLGGLIGKDASSTIEDVRIQGTVTVVRGPSPTVNTGGIVGQSNRVVNSLSSPLTRFTDVHSMVITRRLNDNGANYRDFNAGSVVGESQVVVKGQPGQYPDFSGVYLYKGTDRFQGNNNNGLTLIPIGWKQYFEETTVPFTNNVNRLYDTELTIGLPL